MKQLNTIHGTPSEDLEEETSELDDANEEEQEPKEKSKKEDGGQRRNVQNGDRPTEPGELPSEGAFVGPFTMFKTKPDKDTWPHNKDK